MTFNPDRSKQAQEKATHPPLLFNNNNVSKVNSQKHLGVIIYVKLTFEEHLKNVFNQRYYIVTVLLASDFYFIFLCCGIALKIELSCKFPAEFCNLRWIR